LKSKNLNNHLQRSTAALLVRIDGRSRVGLQQQVYAAVRRGKVLGVQFHPEKSSVAGVRFVQAFLTEVCT